MKGISFFGEVLMRVLTLRGYEAYRANTLTRRRMHVNHMCAMLILPALPHFSEATKQRVSTE